MNIYLLLAGWGLLQMEYLTNILVFLLKFGNFYLYRLRYDADSHGNIIGLLDKETISSSIAIFKSRKIPSGFFVNRKAIGYIDASESYGGMSDIKISILTTQNYFDYLTTRKEIVVRGENEINEINTILKSKISSIRIFNRYGIYSNICYSRLLLNLKNINPLPSQETIVNDIITEYKRKEQLVIFIDGIPCSGKSSIGYLVSKQLGASFCHTFNPTDPGDNFQNLITHIRDSSDTPETTIVIVLEEIDILLYNIHNQRLRQNEDVPTSVKDKSSWSSFLDDMFLYQNIILIMTSNKSKNEIDLMDTAYLRNGRVDLYYTMSTPIIK